MKRGILHEQNSINRMIENISSEQDAMEISKVCQNFIQNHELEMDFDKEQGWSEFQKKISDSQKREKYNSKIKIKRMFLIAAVITVFSICTVIASPVKRLIHMYTDDILIVSNEKIQIEEQNKLSSGIYASFEDVPFDVIYPMGDQIELSKGVDVDEFGNILAFYKAKNNDVECTYCISNTNIFFVEKNQNALKMDYVNGVEFCTVKNNDWATTVWSYDHLFYMLIYPKEKEEEYLQLFLENLHFPESRNNGEDIGKEEQIKKDIFLFAKFI